MSYMYIMINDHDLHLSIINWNLYGGVVLPMSVMDIDL